MSFTIQKLTNLFQLQHLKYRFEESSNQFLIWFLKKMNFLGIFNNQTII